MRCSCAHFRRLTTDAGKPTTDGGHSPVWSPNGRELFYYSGGTMWAVPCAVAYVVAFVVLLVGNVLSNFY